MDKIKIGIPRSLFYYYFNDFWTYFFYKLNINLFISPLTNKQIINDGLKYSNDEMCMALKIYLGHINYLKDKCDYILIPRIDNYGINDQTCTNFLALYDIVNNLFDIKILNYNIDLMHKETELKGLLSLKDKLHKTKKEIKEAYKYACIKTKKNKKLKEIKNINKLKSSKLKVLIISHPYNLYDNLIGKKVIKYLEKYNCEIIYSDLFNNELTNSLSKKISSNLYWKYSKESIGSIELCKKYINGIIFITSFPCGLDSLVNELVMRKIDKPYLNLVIDDINISTGIETRIESFIDILEKSSFSTSR